MPIACMEMFKHFPHGVGFQASATPGIVFDRERAPYLADWQDLADERLEARLTMPLPGDITMRGMLLGIAASLGLDYKQPEEMTEAIDFAISKFTRTSCNTPLTAPPCNNFCVAGVVDAVGFWNSLARMEFLNGQTNTAFMIAESGQYLGQRLHVDPEGHAAPSARPDLRQLAA